MPTRGLKYQCTHSSTSKKSHRVNLFIGSKLIIQRTKPDNKIGLIIHSRLRNYLKIYRLKIAEIGLHAHFQSLKID